MYLNYIFHHNTHFDRLPSIRYRRSLSVSAHDFPHFLDSRIGRHQVVKGQLILVMNPTDVTTPSNLPKDQAESIHVGPLERVEVVHVYRLFKNLKVESISANCRRTVFLTDYRPPRIFIPDIYISFFLIIIFVIIFSTIMCNFFNISFLLT